MKLARVHPATSSKPSRVPDELICRSRHTTESNRSGQCVLSDSLAKKQPFDCEPDECAATGVPKTEPHTRISQQMEPCTRHVVGSMVRGRVRGPSEEHLPGFHPRIHEESK